MDKVSVGKFWTNDERLALISVITYKLFTQGGDFAEGMRLIHFIASASVEFLESNRLKYREYLEANHDDGNHL